MWLLWLVQFYLIIKLEAYSFFSSLQEALSSDYFVNSFINIAYHTIFLAMHWTANFGQT